MDLKPVPRCCKPGVKPKEASVLLHLQEPYFQVISCMFVVIPEKKILMSGKEMNVFFRLSFCRTCVCPWTADMQEAFWGESLLTNCHKVTDI